MQVNQFEITVFFHFLFFQWMITVNDNQLSSGAIFTFIKCDWCLEICDITFFPFEPSPFQTWLGL